MKKDKFMNDVALLMRKQYLGQDWELTSDQKFLVKVCTNDVRDELFTLLLQCVKGNNAPLDPNEAIDIAFDALYSKHEEVAKSSSS